MPAFLVYSREKPVIKKGRCSSCKHRMGITRTIPFHSGLPILCDECLPLRLDRIRYNLYCMRVRAQAAYFDPQLGEAYAHRKDTEDDSGAAQDEAHDDDHGADSSRAGRACTRRQSRAAAPAPEQPRRRRQVRHRKRVASGRRLDARKRKPKRQVRRRKR